MGGKSMLGAHPPISRALCGVLFLCLARVATPQTCPATAQLPAGAADWTSCACNPGYTNTSGLVNLARACSAGGCTVTGPVDVSPVSSPEALTDGDVSEFATLAHTWTANNDWLMIDLQQPAFVNHVRVFNRNRDSWCAGQPVNTCESRLNNFQIRVGFSSTFSNNPACVTGEAWFYDVKNFSCNLNGRFVSIQQLSTKHMNLLNPLRPDSGCPLRAGTGHGRPGRTPGRCGCAVTSLMQRGC